MNEEILKLFVWLCARKESFIATQAPGLSTKSTSARSAWIQSLVKFGVIEGKTDPSKGTGKTIHYTSKVCKVDDIIAKMVVSDIDEPSPFKQANPFGVTSTSVLGEYMERLKSEFEFAAMGYDRAIKMGDTLMCGTPVKDYTHKRGQGDNDQGIEWFIELIPFLASVPKAWVPTLAFLESGVCYNPVWVMHPLEHTNILCSFVWGKCVACKKLVPRTRMTDTGRRAETQSQVFGCSEAKSDARWTCDRCTKITNTKAIYPTEHPLGLELREILSRDDLDALLALQECIEFECMKRKTYDLGESEAIKISTQKFLDRNRK